MTPNKPDLKLIDMLFTDMEERARHRSLVSIDDDERCAEISETLDWAYHVLAHTLAEEKAATGDLFPDSVVDGLPNEMFKERVRYLLSKNLDDYPENGTVH